MGKDSFQAASSGFVKDINKLFSQSLHLTWTVLRRRFKSLERHYKSKRVLAPVSREIERRVREILLTVSITKELPFSEIQRCFDALCKLGFSNLDLEFDYSMLYAITCLQHRENQRGLLVLETLKERINAEKPIMQKKALAEVRQLERKLKKSQVKTGSRERLDVMVRLPPR